MPQRQNHRPRTALFRPEGSDKHEPQDEPRRCRCASCNWTFSVDVPEGADPEVYATTHWFCPHCGQGSAAELPPDHVALHGG